MPCTNASGTERLDIKFIGHAARPRCFGGRPGIDHSLYCSHNKKAWMRSGIFLLGSSSLTDIWGGKKTAKQNC